MTIRLTYARIAAGLSVGLVAAVFLSGVAYAITSNVFLYSRAQTGWYSIHSAALVPVQSGLNYTVSSGELVSSSGGCFDTDLRVPDGAELTQLQVWYKATVSDHLQFYLERKALNSGNASLFLHVISSDVSSNYVSQVFSITGQTINDRANAYAFGVCPPNDNTAFEGARITYRYRNACD
jgi:hypothetical protein